jgi:uncharacterized protein YrzB (UPF0473 family)
MMADNHNTNEDEDILVTLDLDDGSQVECEILTIFTVNEQDYIFFRSPKPASRTRTARSISIAMRRIAMAVRLWIIF